MPGESCRSARGAPELPDPDLVLVEKIADRVGKLGAVFQENGVEPPLSTGLREGSRGDEKANFCIKSLSSPSQET